MSIDLSSIPFSGCAEREPFNQARSVEVAKLLIDSLYSKGQQAIIAGGYPRDLHFGAPPKDIDVVVAFNQKAFSMEAEEEVFEILTELCHLIRLAQPDLTVSICQAYDCVELDRLLGVMKVEGKGVAVDVIVYSDAYISGENTTHKVVGQFDCNLNQFVIKDDKLAYWGTVPLTAGLHFYPENDINDGRIEKATKYWEQYVLGQEFYLEKING